jgi:hypothetical protein
MKILLVSEGKHEIQTGGERGALQVLVERLLECECEIETRKVSDPAIIREVGKGDGMFKRAVAWMRFAMNHDFDAIVLVIDEDGFRDRLKQIDDAQVTTVFEIPRALGVAIRSFDAWILADEVAMASALGAPVNRQPDMESIRDPKEVCRSLCERHMSLSAFYSLVLTAVNITDLETRCAKGFAPFATRVRSLRCSG